MTGIKKPCAIEDDLDSVVTRKDGSQGRCVPLGSGETIVLPVCSGEQHKPEGYEHSLEEGDQKMARSKKENTQDAAEENRSGDESLNG